MQIPLFQVDAFTDTVFHGNPAAVCPLDHWLSDEIMQSIASENNLSETAFFINRGDLYELRWFTPNGEVDLCGHATLATAHVLFQHLTYPQEIVHFSSRSGILSVRKNKASYIMDFPADAPAPHYEKAIFEEILSCKINKVLRGKDDFLVIIDSEKQLETLRPNIQLIEQLESRGLIVSATGLKYDFVSRCFYPKYGVNEDPVTGSAHTLLTPYWATQLNKNKLSAKQISKRGGEIICELKKDRVHLIGKAITFLKGDILI